MCSLNSSRKILLFIVLLLAQSKMGFCINYGSLIDLKIQLINANSGQPLPNQMIVFNVGYNTKDTVYSDSLGNVYYTFEHYYPQCCCSFYALRKNLVYRQKKIRINFTLGDKNFVIKVKHRKYNYSKFRKGPHKLFETRIKA